MSMDSTLGSISYVERRGIRGQYDPIDLTEEEIKKQAKKDVKELFRRFPVEELFRIESNDSQSKSDESD